MAQQTSHPPISEATRCAFCGEQIEGETYRRGNRVYCHPACAFEDERRRRCGCKASHNDTCCR